LVLCILASPGHDKQLSHHTGALADVLLHQLTATDTDESAVSVVSNSTRQQRLARSWWPIQQHTLQIHTASAPPTPASDDAVGHHMQGVDRGPDRDEDSEVVPSNY